MKQIKQINENKCISVHTTILGHSVQLRKILILALAKCLTEKGMKDYFPIKKKKKKGGKEFCKSYVIDSSQKHLFSHYFQYP